MRPLDLNLEKLRSSPQKSCVILQFLRRVYAEAWIGRNPEKIPEILKKSVVGVKNGIFISNIQENSFEILLISKGFQRNARWSKTLNPESLNFLKSERKFFREYLPLGRDGVVISSNVVVSLEHRF